MLHAIRDHPSTAAVAASWPQPTHGGLSTDASVGDTTLGVGCELVSPEYLDLLGINVLRGRLFASDERSPAAGVVGIPMRWRTLLAERRRARPAASARRRVRRRGRRPGGTQVPARLFTVIGVVRDVHSALRIFDFGYSGIYLPTTPEQARTSLVLRVHGDPDTARRTLLDALTKVDPALVITTMKMMAGLDAAILGVVFWMAVILGSLALALTVSGLFGVLSYLVEQRRTEIGVRWRSGRRRATS